MLERTKQRWRTIGRIAVASAGAGVALGLATGGTTRAAVFHNALLGALIGTTLSTIEAFAVYNRGGARLRHWPLGAILVLRTVVYATVIIVAYLAAAVLAPAPGDNIYDIDAFATTFAYALAISFAFSLAFLVRRLLGPQATAHFLTGRYHRPREEERLVLFLDLVGSTTIAERIGDARFHELLARAALDISDVVTECGGEIYRYVGDEVIVSWRLRQGRTDGRALLCPFAIAARIAESRAEYERRFATIPSFRAGIHAGRLILGEMGDLKREIVMLGDVMNAASRIEDACRSTGRTVLASADALACAALPPALGATSIGPVALRGKTADVELFALAPA